MILTDAENEALRHAVLEILVTRHPAALTLRALCRRAATELDFPLTEDQVLSAVELLKGLEYVEAMPDALGSTRYFRATAQGVLVRERTHKR